MIYSSHFIFPVVFLTNRNSRGPGSHFHGTKKLEPQAERAALILPPSGHLFIVLLARWRTPSRASKVHAGRKCDAHGGGIHTCLVQPILVSLFRTVTRILLCRSAGVDRLLWVPEFLGSTSCGGRQEVDPPSQRVPAASSGLMFICFAGE